jgi:hypothetical protein
MNGMQKSTEYQRKEAGENWTSLLTMAILFKALI